jgi:nitrogen-specific signal transduction histidine kinase
VLNSNELEDIIKNKIIYTNLYNPESSNAGLNLCSKDSLEESDELSEHPSGGLDASTQNTFLSNNSFTKTEDLDEGEEDFIWNSLSIDELNNTFSDEVFLDYVEEKGFSIDDVMNFDYSSGEDMGEINPEDEPSILFAANYPPSTVQNSNATIIDRIKNDLKNNNTLQIEKPEKEVSKPRGDLNSAFDNSEDSKLVDQDKEPTKNTNAETFWEDKSNPGQSYSNQTITKENQELTKKITESIFNEISNPIELIKKYAHLLMQKSSSVEANKILHKIIDQSNYIINSLRTHTAYLEEKLELKSQILQASILFDDILYLLAGYTEFRNVKLYRKFDADASILVDKNLIYQACLQIIKFLCENMTNEGSIFVTVNRTKDIIFVEFKSTGNKIPDELLEKVFEPFTIKDTAGLGLAKKIISEHNGNITVINGQDSEPEIKVFLPIVK